jgi:hypothetical protein
MNVYLLLDRAVRLVLSLSIVLGVIFVGWLVAYKCLLEPLPVVRELLGRGRKQPRPEGRPPRRVLYAPQLAADDAQ